MTAHPSEGSLPTLTKLGVTLPPSSSISASSIASSWLASFAQATQSSSVADLVKLFVPATYSSNSLSNDPNVLSAYWRDILALTWDFRTFEGTASIEQFLSNRLAQAKVRDVRLRTDYSPAAVLQQPYPDLAWIQALFTFETGVGTCSGVVRLIPVPSTSDDSGIEWKAHTVLTVLEDLHGFPELTGPLRDRQPNHGKWEAERVKEMTFANADPTALVVGGGQSGLEVAARLKYLGVSCLVVEKNVRLGDNWRKRYEALCLHDPVWYDHMAYLPFPPTWPVYTPAKKLAAWLESYATILELNVWTSSTVLHASQDLHTSLWTVIVKKPDGEERSFVVKHLIFALGFKGGEPYMPKYPGMDIFKGQILHSLQHDKAEDHAGKKVVVVGSCTSAHDICTDYYEHGVDVTMYQRSSTYIMSTKNGIPFLLKGQYEESNPSTSPPIPPTDIADRIGASFPNLLNVGIDYRRTIQLAEADRDILDGLHARGFRTNKGFKDAGFFLLAWTKAGGYYLDVGASQLIIDGKIKLKNDALIERFTEDGLKFENGTELKADVVVFCTGLSDPRDGIRRICGDTIADNCSPIWGLNSEGEINGAWRDMGFKGLWYMMGNLAQCRFHSKHLALQIKAMEEGLFGERYSATQ